MSGSFLAIALVAAVMIVFWRVTLLVAVALLIAGVVSGLSYVSTAANGPAVTFVSPAAVPVQAGPPR